MKSGLPICCLWMFFLCTSCAIMSHIPGIFLFTVTLPRGDDNDQMALPVGLKRIQLWCVLALLYTIEQHNDSLAVQSNAVLMLFDAEIAHLFYPPVVWTLWFLVYIQFSVAAQQVALFPRAVSWHYCNECANLLQFISFCMHAQPCPSNDAVAHKFYWSYSLFFSCGTKRKLRKDAEKYLKYSKVVHLFLSLLTVRTTIVQG